MPLADAYELSARNFERERLLEDVEAEDEAAAQSPFRRSKIETVSGAIRTPSSLTRRQLLPLLADALLHPYEALFLVASSSRPGPRLRSSRPPWRSCVRSWSKLSAILSALTLAGCVLFALLSPSYADPPRHYKALRRQAQSSVSPGRANLLGEKIFIAASLYDPQGQIVSGAWGQSVLRLIDLLGPENCFLSIYESDSGPPGALALQELESDLRCDHRLVSEDTVSWNDTARIPLPDGELGIKRIAYLAQARNRALEPLDTPSSRSYDKILYLNDVVFDPVEAAQLLFFTNSGNYRAACALDFIDPFKFYDICDSRRRALSRRDVLQRRDAVSVRSCWGGMVALDARYFQIQPEATRVVEGKPRAPLRFRSEPDLDWEYSECCLIHADLRAIDALPHYLEYYPDIYLNPYVRTAYSERTFMFLGFVRRIERLLQPIQSLANLFARLPHDNERRTIPAGQDISKIVWVQNSNSSGGQWERQTLPANLGGFCGTRDLMVRRLHPMKGREKHRNWERLPMSWVPSILDSPRSWIMDRVLGR